MSHAVLEFWRLVLQMWMLVHHHPRAIRRVIPEREAFRRFRRLVDYFLHVAFDLV